MYRDDSQGVRYYQGPKNNRIDRVDAVSNNFRIQGVPNHIQKTNLFVEEDLVFKRTRRHDVSQEDENGFPTDFECLANRITYVLPTYPSSQLARIPRAGDNCVDPAAQNGYTFTFRRWPLNRTFDRVLWRAENSVDSYDSQVFDVTDLQPWLSHNLCTQDVGRTNPSSRANKLWQDADFDEKMDFVPPNLEVPISYKSRVVFGTFQDIHDDEGDWEGFQEYFDEQAGDDDKRIMAVPVARFANQRMTMDFSNETYRYNTVDQYGLFELARTADDYAIDPFMTDLDPVLDDEGDEVGNTSYVRFWEDKRMIVNGARQPIPDANRRALYISTDTRRQQQDGYCYHQENWGVGDMLQHGVRTRKWVKAYVRANDNEFRITNIGVALPTWRVAVGNTHVDLNMTRPDNMNGFFTNAVQPVEPHGDLGFGNLPYYRFRKDHLGPVGESFTLEKIGEIYYDEDAWITEFDDGLLPGIDMWDQILNGYDIRIIEFQQDTLVWTNYNQIPDQQAAADQYQANFVTINQNMVAYQVQVDNLAVTVATAQAAYDGAAEGSPELAQALINLTAAQNLHQEALDSLHDTQTEHALNTQNRDGALNFIALAQQNLLTRQGQAPPLRALDVLIGEHALLNVDRVNAFNLSQYVANQAPNNNLAPGSGNVLSGMRNSLTKWRFEFSDSPMGKYLKRRWGANILLANTDQDQSLWWGHNAGNGLVGSQFHQCVATTETLPFGFHPSVTQGPRLSTIDAFTLRQAGQYEENQQHLQGFYFQESAAGFVFNRDEHAECIAKFGDVTAVPILSFDELEEQGNEIGLAAIAQPNDQIGENIRTLSITDYRVHALNRAEYQDMRFEVFAYQPRAVQPAMMVGFTNKLYEPFFSFGSGTGLFPCKRPLDQQQKNWPIAIQDYEIDFQRRFDKGIFNNPVLGPIDTEFAFGAELNLGVDIMRTLNKYTQSCGNLKLIVNSSDTGEQNEKDVSTILQYAPHLVPFQTEPVLFSTGAEGITQKLFLERGFPSYFFIRLEWEAWETQEDFYIPRAAIQSVNFKLFDQENTYTSKLTENELYYLARENCHKYCGFNNLWDNENAVLLSLADIGLMTEKLGYPRRKRLELEISVTWNKNMTLEERMETIGEDAILQNQPLRLRTVLVYENGEFSGDIRRSEFVERYM